MRFLYKGIPKLCIFILVISFLAPVQGANANVAISAHNAILMDEESGRVIYEVNAHEKNRIASITKIMTAILAIESGEMDETVTISSNAFGTEGSSLYLKEGEKIKLEDLVYGLMLRSGNDAAVAISEKVGGSLDGFIWMMNQKAEEIGMKNSHFTNPHGLDNTKNHYSTAYDMALLTRYAMQNKTYAKIAGTKVHRAPNSTEDWDYVWKNKNRLLTQLYEYCTGGKTGYTKLAKRTLVTTATKNKHNLIAVTLNGPDDWNDHINMYETAFKDYSLTEILPEGSIKDIKNTTYKGHVYFKNDFSYPLTKDERELIKVKMKFLKPEKKWKDKRTIPEVVGKAYIYMDGEQVGSRSIFYGEALESFKQESFKSSWAALFEAVLGIERNG